MQLFYKILQKFIIAKLCLSTLYTVNKTWIECNFSSMQEEEMTGTTKPSKTIQKEKNIWFNSMQQGCRWKTHVSWIYRICHDFHPPFEGGNLKQRQIGPANVVKLHLGVDPHRVVLLQARGHVRNYFRVDRKSSRNIKALYTCIVSNVSNLFKCILKI